MSITLRFIITFFLEFIINILIQLSSEKFLLRTSPAHKRNIKLHKFKYHDKKIRSLKRGLILILEWDLFSLRLAYHKLLQHFLIMVGPYCIESIRKIHYQVRVIMQYFTIIYQVLFHVIYPDPVFVYIWIPEYELEVIVLVYPCLPAGLGNGTYPGLYRYFSC